MITRFTLRNFRNHSTFSHIASPEGTLFFGKNGAGKTSLLESLFLLSTLKSFRSHALEECVQKDTSFGEVILETEEEELVFRITTIPQKAIFLSINGVKKTSLQFLKEKKMLATLFSPEDLLFPFASPEYRRRYMNRVLFPVDPELFSLGRIFDRVRASRNALLKRIAAGHSSRAEILFFDEELARTSESITKARSLFWKKIEPNMERFFRYISGKTDGLSVHFLPNTRTDLRECLEKSFAEDLLRGSTRYGAHRDDVVFFLRGAPLSEVGSRGEVRSAILSLKMAEKAFLEEQTGREPVLLLDDVFSELDADRRKHLGEFLGKSQVFLTATDIPQRAFREKPFVLLEIFSPEHSFLSSG